jgi:hypothetical protein
VKQIIRRTTIENCEKLARTVLRFEDERQVMNYLLDRRRSEHPEAL